MPIFLAAGTRDLVQSSEFRVQSSRLRLRLRVKVRVRVRLRFKVRVRVRVRFTVQSSEFRVQSSEFTVSRERVLCMCTTRVEG